MNSESCERWKILSTGFTLLLWSNIHIKLPKTKSQLLTGARVRTDRFLSTLSVDNFCKKSVHVPFRCFSRVNQKGNWAWKWVAEAASPQNGVDFLWWGCGISHYSRDRWQKNLLLFEATFWVCLQCHCLLFILLSPPLLFLGATVSLWKSRLWNTLCDSFNSGAQLVMGQSRLGFLFSFTLWRELTHSSLNFSSRLFCSQITIEAQTFWAAEALLLQPAQIMLLHALSSWESCCFSWETCHGQPASLSWAEVLLQHEATCLLCCIAVGSYSGDWPSDVKVGRDSCGHSLIDFNHNILACSWVFLYLPRTFHHIH